MGEEGLTARGSSPLSALAAEGQANFFRPNLLACLCVPVKMRTIFRKEVVRVR
jgi:hypothetical protein